MSYFPRFLYSSQRWPETGPQSLGKEMTLSGTSWSGPGQGPLLGYRGAWSLSPCGCFLHTSG